MTIKNDGYFYDIEKDVVFQISQLKFDGKDGAYLRSDFLTDESAELVAINSTTTPGNWVSLVGETIRFLALERYLAVTKMAARLVVVHGDNHTVFGPPGSQALIMDFKHSMNLTMAIDNSAMLKALNVIQAGMAINGKVVSEGTRVTYDRLSEYLADAVDRTLSSLNQKIQDAVIRQWNKARHEFVSKCQAHFVHGSTDYEEFLNQDQASLYLRISKTTLNRYRGGDVPNGYDPFPKPDKFHGRTPLWRKSTLAVWAASKR